MRAALILASLVGLVTTPAAAQPRACERSFIILRGSQVVMSGDTADVDRVRRALPSGEPAVWTRTAACKEYLVRDAAVIDEIQRAWKPVNELSAELGKLGEQQGKLGAQQGKLGEKQGELGEKQGELGARLATAKESERVVIERRMRELDARMKILDSIMRTFDQPMRAVDREMNAVEKRQEAAEKQAEAATDAALAHAIASGVAKPFP